MNYHRITSPLDPFFDKCWEIYCESFPLEERRDRAEQENILKKENYFFYALLLDPENGAAGSNGIFHGMDLSAIGEQALSCGIRRQEEQTMIPAGILAYWEFPCCIFGEHLAVSPQYKGNGIGKTVIEFLQEKARTEFPREKEGKEEKGPQMPAPSDHGKEAPPECSETGYGPGYEFAAGELYPRGEHTHLPIILEIELPENETALRRENFYKRLGFRVNVHKHFQPSYHRCTPPVEMLILSWPYPIPEKLYDRFYRYQKEIMPHFE